MPIYQLIGYLLVAFLLILAILMVGAWAKSNYKKEDMHGMGCSVFVVLLTAGLIAWISGI